MLHTVASESACQSLRLHCLGRIQFDGKCTSPPARTACAKAGCDNPSESALSAEDLVSESQESPSPISPERGRAAGQDIARSNGGKEQPSKDPTSLLEPRSSVSEPNFVEVIDDEISDRQSIAPVLGVEGDPHVESAAQTARAAFLAAESTSDGDIGMC